MYICVGIYTDVCSPNSDEGAEGLCAHYDGDRQLVPPHTTIIFDVEGTCRGRKKAFARSDSQNGYCAVSGTLPANRPIEAPIETPF